MQIYQRPPPILKGLKVLKDSHSYPWNAWLLRLQVASVSGVIVLTEQYVVAVVIDFYFMASIGSPKASYSLWLNDVYTDKRPRHSRCRKLALVVC